MAETINQNHQYDYLPEMNEEVIELWAQEYGLTLEECAMIQPTYGYVPSDETYTVPVKTSYGISSGFVTGVNVGINILNLSNRFSRNSEAVNYVGLVSGASQVILGLANVRKDKEDGWINGASRMISYKKQNTLSYFNIGAGTTTILTSAFNLIFKERIKDQRNAVNFYSYSDINNKVTAGLSFKRTL